MFKRILLSVDLEDTPSTHKAARLCVEMAKAFGAEVHVLTVVPEFGYSVVGQYFPEGAEEKIVAEAKKRLHEVVKGEFPSEVKVRHIVAQGSIYHRILEMAEKCAVDLIVVTAHRPDLKDYLLGPNAARVVRHASQSVLVVRADEDGC